MSTKIGIRREDMYEWERRTPLTPEDAWELVQDAGLDVVVQSSQKRVFTDEEYRQHDLPVVESLRGCPIIFGLKEIPVDVLEKDKVYVFFSHTVKGQPENLPMLKRCLDLDCTVIDYERIVDEAGRRLVFFGNYAGLAGMIDSLWTLGRRLAWEGIDTPLAELCQASRYETLDAAKEAIRAVGQRIESDGMPQDLSPFVVGIIGYGNVSKGAQEILDLLPVQEISASDLVSNQRLRSDSKVPILKTVFREQDTVLRLDPSAPFALEEYTEFPERYRAAFAPYLAHLHVLVNCIYWEPKYPRLVTRDAIGSLYAAGQPNLRVIGDISCDVEGAIEVTVKATEPNDPIYVYNPETGAVRSGVEGDGPVMMAVEILPSELPREASTFFSGVVKRFVPAISEADYSSEFTSCNLPSELRRAVIVYRGELTPDYRYLAEHLASIEAE
jgi:hypothetical protein